MKIELNLLNNGLDFILESLKHVWRKDKNIENINIWKYSVLNFSSGIELIFKEKLKQEHWSLIFEDISIANEQKLIQGDFISVNHNELIKRLNGICNITIDDEPLNNLRKIRNKFEHFEVMFSVFECKKAIAEALQVVIKFWNTHILPICDDEQNEKFHQIKEIIKSFDTYVEIKLAKHSKTIETIVQNNAGILIPCNLCSNTSFMILKNKNKKCKCFVCDNSLSKEEYLQQIRDKENGPTFLIPKDYYETKCPRCKQETRVKFYPRYSTDEIVPDYTYCINCFYKEVDPTIEEKVANEWSERMKELENNHSNEEIIQILKNELKNYEA